MEDFLQLLTYLVILIVAVLSNVFAKKKQPLPPQEDNTTEKENPLEIIFGQQEHNDKEDTEVEKTPNTIPQQNTMTEQKDQSQNLLEAFNKMKTNQQTGKDIFSEPKKSLKDVYPNKIIVTNREKTIQMIIGHIIFSKPKCKTKKIISN